MRSRAEEAPDSSGSLGCLLGGCLWAWGWFLVELEPPASTSTAGPAPSQASEKVGDVPSVHGQVVRSLMLWLMGPGCAGALKVTR